MKEHACENALRGLVSRERRMKTSHDNLDPDQTEGRGDAGLGGKCSFRTVDTLLVKHCDVGMRLRYEIECIGYVGLFRPRTPDSPTTFRLPAGGRGDVIVALEPVQWANNFRLIPYGERPRLYCDTGGAQLGVTVRMA